MPENPPAQAAGLPVDPQPWSFRVDEVFTITGRGTGVVGTLRGAIGPGRQQAVLRSRQRTAIPVIVSLQYAKQGDSDSPALLVHDVDKSQVLEGAVITAWIARPNS